MVLRTALLVTLAAMLPAGCHRAEAPAAAAQTVPPKAPRPPADRTKKDRLAEPFTVEVDGKPLVRDDGAHAPFFGDFDGDGRPDLLLGADRDGRLHVYRNTGTADRPRLRAPQRFDDLVPTGRIPAG